MNQIIIRKATKKDAEGKGYVHYQSWKETYTGLFPQEVIDNLSLERSIKIAKEYPENTFIALIDQKIVGFSSYNVSRDEDLEDAGEVRAIYVLKDYQGLGIGKKLMHVCYHELSKYSKMIVWALDSNENAIDFYRHEGFITDGKFKYLYERKLIRLVKDFM